MKKQIKYILFISILGFIIVNIFYVEIDTRDTYYLGSKEEMQLLKKANEGDLKSINRLYLYYNYSIMDYNRSINVLRQGAELGDKRFQYILSLYYTRNSYYPNTILDEQEGLFWLEKSAAQGYEPAIKELSRLKKLNRQ